MPPLLEALGVECVQIHCDPTGEFPHNPEPLPGHLTDLRDAVLASRSDVGVAVDPDVDRLALVSEDGSFFGEEYTLVAVADYVLERHAAGGFAQANNADYSQATVSNLSSTRALRTVTEEHGGSYTASAVGEVNVVDAMKASRAVIGGEGNGGVIYPASHYGRDALVGIALFLSLLARRKVTASALRAGYPPSVISKDKLALPGTGVEQALASLVAGHPEAEVNTIDGVKFDLPEGWVHLRKSNTEPIIRVYAESHDAEAAAALGNRFKSELEALLIAE
jgi:phosphomannomutase